jgi:hypothetical protein
MTQLLELDPRHIAFDQLWPTSWFSKSIRGFSQAEEAIKLCHDANCAQPDAAILVKFGEQAEFEVLDARTTSLTSFLELSNRAA